MVTTSHATGLEKTLLAHFLAHIHIYLHTTRVHVECRIQELTKPHVTVFLESTVHCTTVNYKDMLTMILLEYSALKIYVWCLSL